MKRLLSMLFWTTACLFLLVACKNDDQSTNPSEWEPTPYASVNNLEGVTMEFKEKLVLAEGGIFIIKNDTDKEFTYGDYFSLERKIDDDWVQVPIIEENYGFNAIGYILYPSAVDEFSVEWAWLYGELESGEYRIVKDFLYIRGAGDYDTYDLAAEFLIE